MAKISARGAYAVAEAKKTQQTHDGDVTTVRTLCSDGRILVRSVWRYNHDGMRACSTRQALKATLRSEVTPETANDWIRSMTERQFAARIVQAAPTEKGNAMTTKTKGSAHTLTTEERKTMVVTANAKSSRAKGRDHTATKSVPPRSTKKADRVVSPEDLDAQRARNARTTDQEAPLALVIDSDGIHRVDPPAPDLQPPAPTEAHETPEDLVVFAIRLTKAERDAIHAAAGPGKATKFVRSLAVAAARGDGPTVLGILDAVQK
jgi:hypothetical protein